MPCHVKLLYENGIYNIDNLDMNSAVIDGVKEGLMVVPVQKMALIQSWVDPILIASSSVTLQF